VSGPLSHIRVLDFTALVQGPMATQLLGDLGADVIKFEREGGEWMRSWGILNGKSHGEMDSFLAFNRNKRSVAVDLRKPEVRDRILELAADADVVVENFRPGVMGRLGLAYEDFRAVNPRIIYASSSGYGQTGPYVKRPGQDLLIQALSGLMFLTGRDGDPPTACGVGVTDQYTALHIAIGILAALVHRAETGIGQAIEVDLFSCTVAMQQQELTFYLNHGFLPERPKENLGSVWATAPFGIYQTSDGHIAIAMTPCPVLAEALDQPWLSQFDTLDKMVESRAEIYAGLAAQLLTGTTDHWLATLLEHDVWCAPVQNYEQLTADPQVAHNRLFWDVPVGDGEASFRTPGSPITFSATPASIRYGVPRAGQHTAQFFEDAAPPAP
jgi:crotonobetainyl-CoA:carnitine CoA-transferase CaiB-like acyl-CoA transferase